jgi:hypothetical protein
MRVPGLNYTVKTVGKIGNKSVSGVKKGVSGLFGFLKSGFGLATDAAKQGIKQGSKFIPHGSKTRRRRRH